MPTSVTLMVDFITNFTSHYWLLKCGKNKNLQIILEMSFRYMWMVLHASYEHYLKTLYVQIINSLFFLLISSIHQLHQQYPFFQKKHKQKIIKGFKRLFLKRTEALKNHLTPLKDCNLLFKKLFCPLISKICHRCLLQMSLGDTGVHIPCDSNIFIITKPSSVLSCPMNKDIVILDSSTLITHRHRSSSQDQNNYCTAYTTLNSIVLICSNLNL